ncbi:MAG: oligoendopeptidase F family protein, partial [Burkholderiales bacterium]|nr:oligoendopeptidase F family protein [Burkholderiales bacterium]
MKRHLAFALACACLATAALAAEERPQDRWNLADLYPNEAAWNADATRAEAQLADIAKCKGKLGTSAKRFRECLDLVYDATKRYYRLGVYAGELESEDTSDPARQALNQKVQVIGTKLSETTSFVSPEVLALGKAKVDAFFKAEPALKIYRHPVNDILRSAPHILDAKGEELLAAFGLTQGTAGSVYRILANSDMPWPTVKLSDGKEVKLDQSAYTKWRESENRDDRKKVFDAFFGKFKEFESTIGTTFYSSLKEDSVYAKVRKYPDSMTRSLDANNLPRAVYDALIKSTNENLPTLHRYFRLRAKMLGVAEMRYYDIYPPLIKGGREYPIDEGVKMMVESVAPLGPEYVAAMKKGLADRWMDVYPRPKKLSGAHMAGDAYDVHPYLLINYNNNYESVSTVAHEWGHAMHSYLSNRAQPFPTASYA